jgi:hypothetical protein
VVAMAVAVAALSATPLAGERVHPRVCASPSSGFATSPLGGGRSERIQRAGKVGYSEALPGTRCLRQRWIRCGGALGRLPSHHTLAGERVHPRVPNGPWAGLGCRGHQVDRLGQPSRRLVD